MYAVIRKFKTIRDLEEAGRRVEAGLVPMMQQTPGFRAYYVVDAGNNSGASISLFDSEDAAQQAHLRAMGWIRDNLGDLIEGEPEVTAGPVLASVEAGAEMVA